MALKPLWITPAGSLGTFVQGTAIDTIQFDVLNAETVTILSKDIPNGLKLDSVNKSISGVPVDMGITRTYEFVLRASILSEGKNYIQDRTFSITILSEIPPVLLTPAGTLPIGLNSENFILNNSTVNFQFSASANSIPAGQQLKYYVEENFGELPPGLKLSDTGLLYGTINDDLELDYKLVQGSYDRDYYDLNPYDYGSPIEPATATTQVVSGKVVGASVTYGGNGYLLDPEIIVGGNVDITSINISSSGIGYTTAPTVLFSSSPVTGGRTAKGYAVLGPIYGITQQTTQTSTIDGESADTIMLDIVDGGDANTIVFAQVDDGGEADISYYDIIGYGVTGIVVTDPGTGYISAPTIMFRDQNTGSGAVATCSLLSGSGAELVARVSSGSVVKIDVVSSGSGYTQAPGISFGLPTAGSRIISKTYKFGVTVSNGALSDTKIYTILVKSEDSLRVDTTFISSDTLEFDSSRTYIQAPIWITPGSLPIIKGDNQYIFDLEVFDPTPTIGKLYFSLMDVNFDGTKSELGPLHVEKNSTTYNIATINNASPVIITLGSEHSFNDGDRIKISGNVGSTELNDNVYYVKVISDTKLELYSDVILANEIDGRYFSSFVSGGTVNPETYYLNLDPLGGEINGYLPYQPSVSKTYTFTVKVQRIVDGEEVASTFKQFNLTVEGNIQGDITFTSPTLIGTLNPNEVSLLNVEAVSSLPLASVVYELIPGYGRNSEVNYIELDLKELNGNIMIDGQGLNPILILEKGQSYKLNMDLDNFTVSFKNIDGSYYNAGLRHSSGAVGQAAQEKSSGYYIFIPPYDTSSKIKLVYTNTKKTGLSLNLQKYDQTSRSWNRVLINSYFSEYDAYNNLLHDIQRGIDSFGVFLDYQKVQFVIKKYNTSTLSWDIQDLPRSLPINPIANPYWLDLDNSSLGILNFGYDGLKGIWSEISLSVVTSMPLNSEGTNNDSKILVETGVYQLIRKISGTWTKISILEYNVKTINDPNVFIRSHTMPEPVTNMRNDIWFKYSSLFNGLDKDINVTLKTLDNLPTDISISLSGEIIGKITPSYGNTYKGYYFPNTLYIINDVVSFDDTLYICTNQYRSSGLWYQDSANWSVFAYSKRTSTTIDANAYGVGKFSIHGRNFDDGTTLDNLFRFRIRAKDTQNVSYFEKDFNIKYEINSTTTLTNIYLQPFLSRSSRDLYFNFITDTTIFLTDSIYRHDDPNFGLQRIPKMLLLGGIESTYANRYVSAVQRNYYDRPLYFGDVKVAIGKDGENVEYEVIYVEINDPYEIGNKSVSQSIKLGFDYDPLTVDYTKIRMDTNETVITDTGLDTIYPSSITLMQNELKNVTLQKTDNVLLDPEYEDWGSIIGQSSTSDDWGLVTERVALEEDFLSVIEKLTNDDRFRPLWMNTSQDGTGNPIGYVKAVPICYVKPGESAKILKLIEKSKFDFKALNFTIDRIIIQNPQGETGDKYIKFINREII